MNLRDKQELNRGFGDALNRAFEFAAVTALMGLIGYGIDRWLGTMPVFLIVFTVLGMIGNMLRMWYSYDEAMRRHDAAVPSAAARAAAGRSRTGS